MKINERVKIFIQVLQGKSVKYVEENKKKLVKTGAVILAVITLAGSVLII